MRVLITGGHGQLGRELERALRALHESPSASLSNGDAPQVLRESAEGRASPPKADAPPTQARRPEPASLKAGLLGVGGAQVLAPDLDELDVTDAGAVERALSEARPDLVVHTAALTDTSLCEEDPDLAMRVNAEGSLHVAQACRRTGAAMAYVSTNEVFDGARGAPYTESDEPCPINAYGRSKLEGERLVRRTLPHHYVVRTAWLYAEGGNNFPAKIMRAAHGRRELSVVTDEVSTPTWTRDLAQAIIRLASHAAYGVYHLTNAGCCSRFQWAAEVLRLAGRADVTLLPTTAAEYGAGPPKPPFTALRNDAAARLGITLRPWEEALAAYFASLRTAPAAAR